MTKSHDATTASRLPGQLPDLEKRQQQQKRLLTFCVAGLVLILLLNLIPRQGGVLGAISFSLGSAFIVLLIISITRGVLEHYPSGQIATPHDEAREQA